MRRDRARSKVVHMSIMGLIVFFIKVFRLGVSFAMFDPHSRRIYQPKSRPSCYANWTTPFPDNARHGGVHQYVGGELFQCGGVRLVKFVKFERVICCSLLIISCLQLYLRQQYQVSCLLFGGQCLEGRRLLGFFRPRSVFGPKTNVSLRI